MVRSGGGHTHITNVLPELCKVAPDLDFVLMASSAHWKESFDSFPNLKLHSVTEGSMWNRYFYLLSKASRVAKAHNADLYFSVAEYTPPSLPCPAIASFRNPNVFTRLRQGWGIKQKVRLGFLRRLAKASARRCARILFVSHDSANWIGAGIGLPLEKRVVIHHGIDATRFSSLSAVQERAGVGVLSVSSVYRYKNFVRLIEVWHLWVERAGSANVPDLTIIGDGQDPWYLKQMQRAIDATAEESSRIHFLGAVPYSEVPSYYAAASLFVFPSYLETFGHPLVEAMASDLPVVAADIPVFREIAGDSALYADPYDVEALSQAMESGFVEGGDAAVRMKNARRRVSELSWNVNARRLADLFREVISEARHAS